MGSKQDAVTAAEVAKLLDVDIRTLQRMVRNGLLQPSGGSTRVNARTTFNADEVSAFAETRFKKLDFGTVAGLAMRAFAISKANERRINHLSELLGLDLPALETDEASVVQLYIAAEDFEHNENEPPPFAEMRRWTSILFGIDENYLQLVEHYTMSVEPWRPFFDLAQRFLEQMPANAFLHPNERIVYARLAAAQRHLRNVMYFYYRNKNGRRAADRAFPEMNENSVEAELAAILFPG